MERQLGQKFPQPLYNKGIHWLPDHYRHRRRCPNYICNAPKSAQAHKRHRAYLETSNSVSKSTGTYRRPVYIDVAGNFTRQTTPQKHLSTSAHQVVMENTVGHRPTSAGRPYLLERFPYGLERPTSYIPLNGRSGRVRCQPDRLGICLHGGKKQPGTGTSTWHFNPPMFEK